MTDNHPSSWQYPGSEATARAEDVYNFVASRELPGDDEFHWLDREYEESHCEELEEQAREQDRRRALPGHSDRFPWLY